MPNDIERAVSPDVITTLMFEHGLKPFDVPYTIEGTVRIYATDADSAKALIDGKDPLDYVDLTTLQTYAAKVAAQ